MQPRGVNIRYVSGVTSYNINWADDVINVDTSVNPVTIYLPSIAQGGTNKRFYINDYNGNAATNNITIATSGTDVVNGAATKVLSANGVTSELLISGVGEWLANTDAVTSVGTVTSVGLALPVSVFSISGSPVTGSGTLTGAFVTQSANTVFAGPTTGGAAVPAFRALVAADIPALSGTYFQNGGNSFGGNATIGLNDAFSLSIETNNTSRINILGTGEVGVGVAGTASTALTVKGATSDNTTYAEKWLDSSNNVNFSVRNNGEVSSLNGYWLRGTKMFYPGVTSLTNIFIGELSGNLTQNGNNNIGVGSNTLQLLTTGLQNLALSSNTLKNVLDGNYNVSGGHGSLQLLDTGSANSVWGNEGMANATSATSCISIGAFSLASLVTGNRVIGIGRSIDVTTSAISDSIGIGSNAFITASNQLIIGSIVSPITNAYIGEQVSNPNANLFVGAVGINTTTITSTIASIKGAGSTSSTYGVKVTNSSNSLNFYISDDGAVNSRLGYWINGGKVLYFGAAAVTNLFCGGGNDTLSGINNTICSANGGTVLTTGFQNSLFGSYAGENCSTSINVTAVGFEALRNNTIGFNNTGVGATALVGTIDGDYNNALGASAGAANITGNNLTFIGSFSDCSATNLSDSVAIGQLSMITASNQFIVGSPLHFISDYYFGGGFNGDTTIGAISFNPTGITAGQTNISASANVFNLCGAVGTGTGVGGDIVLKVALAGSTGSTRNTLATKMTISGTTGTVAIAAGISAGAQLNLAPGVAPASPVDGDIYYIDTADRLMFFKNATACEIISASAVTTEVLVSDTTLTITFNGTTYKLLARA